MNHIQQIYLGQIRNAENLQFAHSFFYGQGYNTDYTLGDAIRTYRKERGYSTHEIADKRQDFHDGVHAITLTTQGNRGSDKSIINEAHEAIGEIVLLRGAYDSDNTSRNQTNDDAVTKPLSIPAFEHASDLVQKRLKTLNDEYDKNIQVAPAELRETYNLCVSLDLFFQTVSNGRILDQLSSRQTPDICISVMDMPICYFGVMPPEDRNSLPTEHIPAPIREKLKTDIANQRPHKTPLWDFTSDLRKDLSEQELEARSAAIKMAVSPPPRSQPAPDPAPEPADPSTPAYE